MVDKEWFNPFNVILEFKRLEKSGIFVRKTNEYKKAKEAYISAISLVGLANKLGIDFWMQIVDDKEQSPDIRTTCPDPVNKGNFSIQDVEIVTFTKYSTNDIVEFLLQTKLSAEKGYDDLTNILCFIDKEVYLPSINKINEKLLQQNLNKKSPILLMGRIYQDKDIYRIVQVYPDTTIDFTFDLYEECKKIKYSGRLYLDRNIRKGKHGLTRFGEKILPFKKMSLE